MLAMYHFMLFSGLVFDIDVRDNIGWSLNAFVGLLLVFNVIVILKANLSQLHRSYRLWRIRSKAQEASKARVQKAFDRSKS